MGLYLIKVTACLAIFFVFYKVMLENESMHTFKRFYLLTALIVAAVIPTILFTEYIYISPEPIVDIAVSEFTIKEMPLPTQKNDLITPSLWVIYGIGVLVFGYKFCNNLFKLSTRIKRNPKIKYDRSIHVLLEERLSPHTFFNFIFLNKQKFEAHEIPEAVLLHEQTHAAQKHSIDVLFIELIQVLLWFNPLVYLFKGAIKLNHEFLADQAVLKKGTQLPNYQQILLAFSSNATETQLANAINYSSIKKRFTIMKKTTSKKAVWLRSLLALPIFVFALYGFSEKKILKMEKPSQENSELSSPSDLNKVSTNHLQDEIESYKKEYNAYVVLTKEKPHYIHKPESEKRKMDDIFSNLVTMYYNLSNTNRAKVTAATPPIKPYTTLIKNGQKEYKKTSELTAEDKKLLPPPPPPPLPISESNSTELAKAKQLFLENANRYGNAVSAYTKQGTGTLEELNARYKKIMNLYEKYTALVKKEETNPILPPLPQHHQRVP
ncbi:peptidase M56 BlaR1 [Cellulophaga algicola DSM 14237]|uniref:Peptidase M56 BlaR1 n=1 Tax=Cellulophaga algicola (strain DSM 14237 / IC166 / ACAM 630) TaxID=688270 RepID=E6X3X2_CELAD|nr:M56 family metallopeptidase [Cellulophaga algicola]ADV49297.1 peptidase M56 BlaR1 [Cellulophaga algicola DSM 14237]